MSTQAELAKTLQDVLAQQKKSLAEIQNQSTTLQQKIADLEAVIAAGGAVTPELEQAVADVKAQAQLVDDAIPDTPEPPPAP